MSVCTCGHTIGRHCDGIGRCDGTSTDPQYGTYKCVCPVYQPKQYCSAKYAVFNGWSGTYPRCAQPPGHDGPHMTTYGLKFDDEGQDVHDNG